MAVRLEHVNLIVQDIDEMVRFFQTAFPEFRIRHDGRGSEGSDWEFVEYLSADPAERNDYDLPDS